MVYPEKKPKITVIGMLKLADFFFNTPTARYTFMKGQMISYGKKIDKKANTSA